MSSRKKIIEKKKKSRRRWLSVKVEMSSMVVTLETIKYTGIYVVFVSAKASISYDILGTMTVRTSPLSMGTSKIDDK